MAGSRHSNFRISAAPVLLALCVALYAVGLLRPVSAACGAGDACSGHGTCTQSPAYAQTTKHCECDAGYIVQDCSVATGRATRGLSTLYTMHEAGGCTVHDVSGRGAPHDLRYFADEESLEWGPGLISSDHVPNPTRVFSFEPPIKAVEAAIASGGFTIEAWWSPATTTISYDDQRVIMIGWGGGDTSIFTSIIQFEDQLDSRVQTSACGANTPPCRSWLDGYFTATEPTHVALTFDGVSLKSYRNGELVLTSLPIVGDLTPWSTEMIWGTELALLNRVDNLRDAHGKLYLAAFYTEPLTAEEVQTNFNVSYNKTAAAGGVFENACDPDEPSCAAVNNCFGPDSAALTMTYAEDCFNVLGPNPLCADAMRRPFLGSYEFDQVVQVVHESGELSMTPSSLNVYYDPPAGALVDIGPGAYQKETFPGAYEPEFTPGTTPGVYLYSVYVNGAQTAQSPIPITVTSDFCSVDGAPSCGPGVCVTRSSYEDAVCDCPAGFGGLWCETTIVRNTTSLLALWLFEETDGDVAHDVSGVYPPNHFRVDQHARCENRSFDLLDNGPGVRVTTGNYRDTDYPRRNNDKMVADEVGFLQSSFLATEQITMEIWFALTNPDLEGPARIVSLSESSNSGTQSIIVGQVFQGFSVRFASDGCDLMSPGEPCYLTYQDSLDMDTVYHLVVAAGGDDFLRIYIDGSLFATEFVGRVFTPSVWGSSGQTLKIGNSNDDREWAGLVYQVALYNRALGEAEINSLYQLGYGAAAQTTNTPCLSCATTVIWPPYYNCTAFAAQADLANSFVFAREWPQTFIDGRVYVADSGGVGYFWIGAGDVNGRSVPGQFFESDQIRMVVRGPGASTATTNYYGGFSWPYYYINPGITKKGNYTIESVWLGSTEVTQTRLQAYVDRPVDPMWRFIEVLPAEPDYARLSTDPPFSDWFDAGTLVTGNVSVYDAYDNEIEFGTYGYELVLVSLDLEVVVPIAPSDQAFAFVASVAGRWTLELRLSATDEVVSYFHMFVNPVAISYDTSRADDVSAVLTAGDTFTSTLHVRDAYGNGRLGGILFERHLSDSVQDDWDDLYQEGDGSTHRYQDFFGPNINNDGDLGYFGLHIDDVPFPAAGGNLLWADVQFTAFSDDDRDCPIELWCEDVGDATSPIGSFRFLQYLPRTSARAYWHPPPWRKDEATLDQLMPDITAPIAEVFARGDFDFEDEINIIGRGPTFRSAYARDAGEPDKTAVFRMWYSLDSGQPNTTDGVEGELINVDRPYIREPIVFVAQPPRGSGAYTYAATLTKAGNYSLRLTAPLPTGGRLYLNTSNVHIHVDGLGVVFGLAYETPTYIVLTTTARLCAVVGDALGNWVDDPPATAPWNNTDLWTIHVINDSPSGGPGNVTDLDPVQVDPGRLCIDYTASDLGSFYVEARFNGSLVNGTVAPFVVDTGEVDVSKTEISGPAAANGVVQLAGNAFTMQLYDSFGNERLYDNLITELSMNIAGTATSSRRGLLQNGAAITATYQGFGAYLIFYNVTVAGTYEVRIGVEYLPIPQSPIMVAVAPGLPAVSRTAVRGPGALGGSGSNLPQVFWVDLYDAFGNAVADSTPHVVTAGVKDSAQRPTAVVTTNFGNGTYELVYYVSSGGLFVIDLAIDGQPFPNQFFVEIVAYCPIGSFSQGLYGPCSLCAPGSFTATPSQLKCDPCPPETTSAANATRVEDCTCNRGFFSPDAVPGVECDVCPSGAVCNGSLTPPFAAPGHFPTTDPTIFLPCPNAAACLGGDPFACLEGYEARLCAQCADGYYRDEDECSACPSSAGLLVLFAFVGWVACGILILINRCFTNAAKFATVNIALNSIQVSVMFGQFDLAWPPLVRSFFRVLSIFNLNISLVAPECVVQGSQAWLLKWIVVMLLPLIVVVAFLSHFLLFGLTQHYCAKRNGERWRRKYPSLYRPEGDASDSDDDEADKLGNLHADENANGDSSIGTLKRSRRRYTRTERCKFMCGDCLSTPASLKAGWYAIVRAWWQILSFAYLPLAAMAIEFLACLQSPDGVYQLRADPSVECYTGWYNPMLPLAIVLSVLYAVGIPAAIGVILWRRRLKLDAISFALKYGFLTARYNDDRYFWEVAIMARKLGVLLCMVFLSRHPIAQGIFACFVLIVASHAHLHAQPFLYQTHNRLEFVSLWSSVGVLGFAIVLKTTNEGLVAESVADFLVVLSLFVNFAALAVVFVIDIRRLMREDAEINGSVAFTGGETFDNSEPADDGESEAMWERATAGSGGAAASVRMETFTAAASLNETWVAAGDTDETLSPYGSGGGVHASPRRPGGAHVVDQVNPVFDSDVSGLSTMQSLGMMPTLRLDGDAFDEVPPPPPPAEMDSGAPSVTEIPLPPSLPKAGRI